MPTQKLQPNARNEDTSLLAAVRARDASKDGQFVYGVRTTLVYCKPSCRSRPARAENMEFFTTAELAERAGYRACKRCKPDEPTQAKAHLSLVADLCKLLETSETPPSLSQLVAYAGMSASHLHRVFKATTGVTPKAYVDMLRQKRLQERLSTSSTITRAIYDSGFNSSGRFYERADRMLGMTPLAYKRGGEGHRIRFAVGQSSLGNVLVASSELGLCWIALGGDADNLVQDVQQRFPNAELLGSDPDFDATVAKVIGVIEDPSLSMDLPLDVRGTAFQCRVWDVLRRIPVGTTVSYAQLASELGLPKAVRAVARACASNTLAIVIPCHRVIRTDGNLSGYRWGIERKRTLLTREGAIHSMPTSR